MSKYMLLYRGPATKAQDMDPAKVQEIMGNWMRWSEACGSALTDFGLPMDNGWAISDQGKEGEATLMNGYSIIEAKDKDEATKLIQGHPFLSDATGNFWVEVHELLPMPGQ